MSDQIEAAGRLPNELANAGDKLIAEINAQPSYYACERTVWKAGRARRREDGGISFGLSIPVFDVRAEVENGELVAQTLADFLTQHDPFKD